MSGLVSVPRLHLPGQTFGCISTAHGTSGGDTLIPFGATIGSATLTANLAFFFPFEVAHPVYAVKMAWLNGTAASGNIDAGIYDTAGNRLASTGSTAQTGTNVTQVAALTAATLLTPGIYFMAIVIDNGTGQLLRLTGPQALVRNTAGFQEMATAFPLPNPATLINTTSTPLPFFSVVLRAAL